MIKCLVYEPLKTNWPTKSTNDLLFDHFFDARLEIMVLFFWKIANTTISFQNFLTFMWATTKCSIKSLTTSSIKQTVCTFILRISTIIVDNHCWGQRKEGKFFVENLQNSNKSASSDGFIRPNYESMNPVFTNFFTNIYQLKKKTTFLLVQK